MTQSECRIALCAEAAIDKPAQPAILPAVEE